MSELTTSSTTPNYEEIETHNIETAHEAVERLARELEVIPAAPDLASDAVNIRSIASKVGDKWIWSTIHGNRPPSGDLEVVDPISRQDDQPIFESAKDSLLTNELALRHVAYSEGRWWMFTQSEKLVDENLKEIVRVQESDKKIDILNCAAEALSQEDKDSIHKAFNAVVNYTGGKIFDRLEGVILAPASEFSEGIVGDFQPGSGVLRINIDSLHGEGQRDTRLERYTPYFEDASVDWFEITLAHELGHAMDISSYTEADGHGIDRSTYSYLGFGAITKEFSAFDDQFGWGHTIGEKPVEGKSTVVKETVHQLDEQQVIECGEFAPTSYAKSNPREDFAESFAITALGGNTSSMPMRKEVLSTTIEMAKGNSGIGPKLITLEQIDSSELIKPIKKVNMQAYVRRNAA